MNIAILMVCLGAGLDLALFFALYWRLDELPVRVVSLAREERADGEARAFQSLNDAASAKVAAITLSLRAYEEQLAARTREAVAAAEIRARVAERRSSDAVTALEAASQLVRELRSMLMDLRPDPPQPALDRPTPDHGDSGAWLRLERPTDPDGDRTRIGVLPSPEMLRQPPILPPHPITGAPQSSEDGAV